MQANPSSRLLDRAAFLGQLDAQATDAAARGEAIGLVLIKLSHLRDINHAFGFTAGDACLDTIGGRLIATARGHDTVGHLGGGLFGVLVAAPCDAPLLELGINRLLGEMERPVQFEERALAIACRAAGGLSDHAPGSADQLLAAVEDGLHEAFREGSPYRLLRLRPEGGYGDDFTLLRAVEQGLERDEFALKFQPQLRLADHTVAGFEALVRLESRLYPDAPTERMIVLAEKNDVILPLTRWTFNAALREFGELEGLPADAKVSVNLSASLLTRGGILDIIADALAIWGVEAQRLMVEITETSMMQNPEASVRAVRSLRELGVRISIDDFGTGYSSLAYLERLPLDELKIDQSFIGRVSADPHDQKLVRAIIDLAHTFGMRVVAEGIENGETERLLRDMGCDIGQGYHFSRPVDAGMLAYWLHTQPVPPPA